MGVSTLEHIRRGGPILVEPIQRGTIKLYPEQIGWSGNNYGELSFIHIGLGSRAESPSEVHPSTTEIYFVLEGTGTLHSINRNGRRHEETVKPSSVVFIPPETPHFLAAAFQSSLHISALCIPAWTLDCGMPYQFGTDLMIDSSPNCVIPKENIMKPIHVSSPSGTVFDLQVEELSDGTDGGIAIFEEQARGPLYYLITSGDALVSINGSRDDSIAVPGDLIVAERGELIDLSPGQRSSVRFIRVQQK